jgi:hypothetical protein
MGETEAVLTFEAWAWTVGRFVLAVAVVAGVWWAVAKWRSRR